jgi:hypothetical protein
MPGIEGDDIPLRKRWMSEILVRIVHVYLNVWALLLMQSLHGRYTESPYRHCQGLG